MKNHEQRFTLHEQRVLFIVGPTAVGKTELAVELAKRLGGEVISADSMQVYRGMDVGTSKPTASQRSEIPHYLVDILEPSQEYSCADFKEKAKPLIEDILARKKLPMVVGGSGLYVRALVDGLFAGPGADWDLRKALYEEAEFSGTEALYERLKKMDDATAENIMPNDARRIIRALEVCLKTDDKISELRKNTQGIISKYDVKMIGLIRERAELYNRIDKRVDEIFERGLVEETEALVKKNPSRTAMQALGYKEVAGLLRGEHSLDEAKRLAKRNTRHFAKRQLSWFRRDKRIEWIDATTKKMDEIIEAITAVEQK